LVNICRFRGWGIGGFRCWYIGRFRGWGISGLRGWDIGRSWWHCDCIRIMSSGSVIVIYLCSILVNLGICRVRATKAQGVIPSFGLV